MCVVSGLVQSTYAVNRLHLLLYWLCECGGAQPQGARAGPASIPLWAVVWDLRYNNEHWPSQQLTESATTSQQLKTTESATYNNSRFVPPRPQADSFGCRDLQGRFVSMGFCVMLWCYTESFLEASSVGRGRRSSRAGSHSWWRGKGQTKCFTSCSHDIPRRHCQNRHDMTRHMNPCLNFHYRKGELVLALKRLARGCFNIEKCSCARLFIGDPCETIL